MALSSLATRVRSPAPQRRAPVYVRPSPDEARLERTLLTGLAPDAVLMRALHCADQQGVTALEALLACTPADGDEIAARLGKRLGVEVLTDFDFGPQTLSVNAARSAIQSGVLRLPDRRVVVGLRGRSLVQLARHLARAPDLARRARIASPRVFTDAVLHAARDALTADVSSGLEAVDEAFSARSPSLGHACAVGALALGAAAMAAAWFSPLALSVAFAILFLALTGLRLLPVVGELLDRPFARVPDEFLPVYTLLVPLYREARCLPGLVGALEALDYPEAKLDIKILLEASDTETRLAVAQHGLPSHFEVIVVPPGEPRTKPRALNAGLALARGSLLAVFDAEDRPEPGQLRAAFHAFQRGRPQIGCVQARLTIDNVSDSWLSKLFALEYAGLFDALLPALSSLGMMFPLGGTSNHFRTALLDRAGGWDAWNVTEDADLGVRLARMGYRLLVISSSTLEEAPNRLGVWLPQRTRWLKGYMTTWALHMRQPVRLLRELGLRDFLVFHAFVGGVPLSALVLPIFLTGIVAQAASGEWLSPRAEWSSLLSFTLNIFNLVIGFGGAIALAAIGADRRRLTALGRWLPTLPAYWLLSSVAAWRAVWQLMRDPHLWEKTPHGLARTSHQDDQRRLSISSAMARGSFVMSREDANEPWESIR